jgi:hypothetical protein
LPPQFLGALENAADEGGGEIGDGGDGLRGACNSRWVNDRAFEEEGGEAGEKVFGGLPGEGLVAGGFDQTVADEEAVEKAGEDFGGEVALLLGLGEGGGEGLGGLVVELDEAIVEGGAGFGGGLVGFADEGVDQVLEAIELLEAIVAVVLERFGEGGGVWCVVGADGRWEAIGGEDGGEEALFVAEVAEEGDFVDFSSIGDGFGGGGGDTLLDEEVEGGGDESLFGGGFGVAHGNLPRKM